jgi:hypothetical protein
MVQEFEMNQDNIFAFVLMPFGQEFDDIYRLGIKDTAKSLGILAERVDEQIYKEGILERIYRQIEIADIIVADMSGKNANVFYEVGYAHANQKLCILLTSAADDIPFDLKHRRHIVYGRSIQTLQRRLHEELSWAENEVRNARKSRISIRARTSGSKLEKTKHEAKGSVEFTIDLTNDTSIASPDIEVLYFYSTKRWSVRHDGKPCASTESDLPSFERRHFLTLPVRRLAPGGWAQIKFYAERILAFAWRGEELKDVYNVAGRSLLRIVTSDGNFDQEIYVDVTIEEFPF